MATRWRRGFFRLWAVVAALWVVIGAASAISASISPYVSTGAVVTRVNATAPTLISTYSDDYRALKYLASKGKVVETELQWDFVLFTAPGISNAELTLRMMAARKLVASHVDGSMSQARWQAFWSFLGFGVVPPTIVLIIGWALAWAFSGFRQQR